MLWHLPLSRLRDITQYLSSQEGNLSLFFCLILFLLSPKSMNIACRYAYKVIIWWLWVTGSWSLITTHSFSPRPHTHLTDVLLCDARQDEHLFPAVFTPSAFAVLSDEYTGNMTEWLGYFHLHLKKLIFINVPKPLDSSRRYLSSAPN